MLFKIAVPLNFINDDWSCWHEAFWRKVFHCLVLSSLRILYVVDAPTEECWNQERRLLGCNGNAKWLIHKWLSSLVCFYRPVRSVCVCVCVCVCECVCVCVCVSEREWERASSVWQPCMRTHPSLQYYKSDNGKKLQIPNVFIHKDPVLRKATNSNIWEVEGSIVCLFTN